MYTKYMLSENCFIHYARITYPSKVSTNGVEQSHFLNLSLDLKPLDGHCDTAVSVQVNPLLFTVTKPFIDRIGTIVLIMYLTLP